MFAVTALISMMEDLSEGSRGRDPQKKKCQWCPYVYSTTYLTPEAKRLLGRR